MRDNMSPYRNNKTEQRWGKQGFQNRLTYQKQQYKTRTLVTRRAIPSSHSFLKRVVKSNDDTLLQAWGCVV